MEALAASLPHIDSDISDDESSGRRAGSVNSSTVLTKDSVADTEKVSRMMSAIDHIEEDLLHCGVYLPGLRSGTGKAVLIVELQILQKNLPAFSPLLDLVRYYHGVPRKSARKNGMVILVVGSPSLYANAMDLVDQALLYFKDKLKLVDSVLIWSPASPGMEINHFILGRSEYTCEVITSLDRLREALPSAAMLEICGGTLVHSQNDWIAFRKVVEPFIDLCSAQGKKLYSVINLVRQCPAKTAANEFDQYESAFRDSLTDAQLARLQNDGAQHLHDIAQARTKLEENVDVREALERCSAMYVEVQRTVNRLSRIWQRRKLRTDKKSTSSQMQQILSWLCRRGEETITRHRTRFADSLSAAKQHEQDFLRFRTLAMRQIEKGEELLSELRRNEEAGTSCLLAENAEQRESMSSMATSLQLQLSQFSVRLEDTRERLEDTTRCYELLDKAYEWGVDAMKMASKLKVDQPCLSMAQHLIQQAGEFLDGSGQITDYAYFEQLNQLAKKLDNGKLLDQCKVAQMRCEETLLLLQSRKKFLENFVRENLNEKDNKQVKNEDYENIQNLVVPGEDVADGRSKTFAVWEKKKEQTEECALVSVEKGELDKREEEKETKIVRGTAAYSSATSLSSFASSSSSWNAAKRKVSQSSRSDSSEKNSTDSGNDKATSISSGEGEDSGTSVSSPKDLIDAEPESECQSRVSATSPLSVNSHLQCRASTIDLSLPLAEMQEAGFAEIDIKTQKTLLLIMREMIQTERDYVRSLEYIIENYIPELSREDIPQALRGKRNVIFGNIEKIHEFHSHYFLRELERCQNVPFFVGQCFLRHEQSFYLYALYNKNKPKSDALMAEYGTAFFRAKQAELGDKMDLASYLLKPVQRMGKYALLLKQLIKESADKEPEFVNLTAAEQMVRFQLRHGNDLLAMDSLRDCDVNVKEQGRLLRQSEFIVTHGRNKKSVRHVFLFEELILFSKAKRDPERKNLDNYIYKQSMKTADIGFTAQVGDSNTKFEIWFRKRKPNETYILEASSPDVKDAWVDDISRILWKQALRNRELRLAEMAEMGVGNKPCLDIRPSQDQISDRSISYAQLSKAPRFRHSVCGSVCSDGRSSKRPHSILSISSSTSSSSSSASGTGTANQQEAVPAGSARYTTNHSQCSAESGIIADLSLSYDDPESTTRHRRVGRSDSSVTTLSVESGPSGPLSPTLCTYSNLSSPITVYVNNTLIPLTPLPSMALGKNIPMTEM